MSLWTHTAQAKEMSDFSTTRRLTDFPLVIGEILRRGNLRSLRQATLEHKEALERHLAQRWQDLFGAKCDLLLYDLTSTYFEGQAPERSRPHGVVTAVIHDPMLCS
jgi:hypothetical protein